MARCLLLGAAGFVGRHVRERLAAEPGVELVTAGRRPGLDVQVDLAVGPVRLADALAEAAPDAVINCAGATSGGAAALVAANTVATAHLVAAVRWARPEVRLVHLGSAAEYGPKPAGVPCREGAACDPVGPYGVSKLAGTQLVTAAGLDAVVLRVFNIVGPGVPEHTLPGRLVAELHRASRTGGEVRVGPLDGHRDFVDVRDVADAVLAAVRTRVETPAVVNIGSGQATPVRSLAAGLAALAGVDGPIREDAAGSERSAAVSWQQADVRLAARVLGWAARTALADSLAAMWGACLDPPTAA